MRLAQAELDALSLLASIPDGAEMNIAPIEDRRMWLGIGYCVGRGYAAYRGSDHYRITPVGRAALRELTKPQQWGSET